MAGIAATCAICLVVTANAFGLNPIRAVLNWAEGIIQIYSNPSGVMELPVDIPSEYHSLEEALTANSISTKGCPTWIPQDFSLYSVRVRKSDGIIKCTASYESERGELIIRVSKRTTYNSTAIEECDDGGWVYYYNDVEYYIVSNFDWAKAGWEDGLNSYVVSGQVSEDELKEIINSIS